MIRGQYLPSTFCQQPSTVFLTTSLWKAVLQTTLLLLFLILAFLYQSSTAVESDPPPPSTGSGVTQLEHGI